MSDIRKWMKIVESVPAIFPGQDPKHALIKQDATIMVDPSVGGGTARYMHSTPDGAMVDIKGIARELGSDEFGLPERDYEDGYQKGNDWFHMSVNPDTPGTSNERPEFRSGDMVKIADVYGSVIGPGMGVFVAYSTSGQEAIISFDNKEIVVPVANIAAVLEQNAKDNFDEMDNDGNLSPMSFGSANVKVEEPAMDQKDEFSKWMSAVEEALQNDGETVEESMPAGNECGCGSWNCPVCFPDETQGVEVIDLGHDHDHGTGCTLCHGEGCPSCDGSELEVVDELSRDTVSNYYDKARSDVNDMTYGDKNDSKFDQRMQGMDRATRRLEKPMEEENEHFIEKPKSGKGVKLGNIVQNTKIVPTDGHESPLSFGGDNLGAVDEADPDMFSEQIPQTPDTPPMSSAPSTSTTPPPMGAPSGLGEDPGLGYESGGMEPQDDMHKHEMAEKILNIQNMGFSKDDRHYSREELLMYSPEEMKACYDRVMGDITAENYAPGTAPTMPEESAKPTKTRHHLDDIEDILNPRHADLPATVDGGDDEVAGGEKPMHLPAASRGDTQRKVGEITPTDQMRDFMNRINPMAGGDEPDILPADNALALRSAGDVPAVISNAMQASGMQNPEWHHVSNLPGYSQQNVRGMGRQLFSMFTNTPMEQIQTMANVNGQGPNTDAEMRAVAGWLRNNAEDMGNVDVNHGMAIPGYKPDVKEYRANGVRFHLVRDPMGQYIYAYPDADAKLGGPPQGQAQVSSPQGDVPRLRESTEEFKLQPTLLEQIKWDEEIEEAFIEESSLSKLIGKQKGGQNLVRWMHRRHGLSNDADLQPAPFSERLLWKQFKAQPDNFVIVTAQNGVAGIKPDKKFIDARTKEFAKKGKQYNPSGDSTLPYQIIAFTDDGQQVDPELLRAPPEDGEDYRDAKDPTVMRARMGKHSGKDMQNPYNVFNLLAEQIGALKNVYISGFENAAGGAQAGSVERDKMAKRADLKKTPSTDPSQAVQMIFQRIRPVLKTLANQAILQINKRAQRYIEGGNFEGAQKVAGHGQKLKQLLVSLDTNSAVNVDTSYVSKTRELSAAITKAIAQASGAPVDSADYKEYASAAAGGSASALRPILDGLRDQLVGL